jgi:hypothetical protein
MPAPWIDPLLRFNASWREDEDGCKIWTERVDKDGYGRFSADPERYGTPRTEKAHRWIFAVKFGYLPPVVMHRCDKPACVNWEGCLLPGTTPLNNADMVAKGRHGHGASGTPRRGQRHHKAILTDAQVMELHALRAAGELTQALADRYGISRSSVSLILSGKRRGDPAPGVAYRPVGFSRASADLPVQRDTGQPAR